MESLNYEEFKRKVFDLDQPGEWKSLSDLPVVINFCADGREPCKTQEAVLEEIANEYAGHIQVYRVNVEVERKLATSFRVQSIPALLFIPKLGKPSMMTGLLLKSIILEAIRNRLGVGGALDTDDDGGGCCS